MHILKLLMIFVNICIMASTSHLSITPQTQLPSPLHRPFFEQHASPPRARDPHGAQRKIFKRAIRVGRGAGCLRAGVVPVTAWSAGR